MTKREEFVASVRKMGTLDVSVLASPEAYPAASAPARRAAQHMVGAVGVSGARGRVDRLASKLEALCLLDHQLAPKRSYGKTG